MSSRCGRRLPCRRRGQITRSRWRVPWSAHEPPTRPRRPGSWPRPPARARASACAESHARVSRRNGNHDHESWVPTSIAPRLMAVRPEPRDDRAHVVLCGVLAVLFLALGAWKADGLGYAAGLLFASLAG